MNTLADPDNTAGACATGGACSLRQAVNAANAAMGPDSIVFDVTGTHRVGGAGTFDAPLRVMDDLTVTGNGRGNAGTRVDGGNTSRIFDIVMDSIVLRSLRLQNGQTELALVDGGGALLIYPAATGHSVVDDVVATGNETSSGVHTGGGAILNSGPGTLTIEGSRIIDNVISAMGGGTNAGAGVNSSAGPLHIIDTTISGNRITAGGAAEGAGVSAGGAFTLLRSTVTGNTLSATTNQGAGIRLNAGPGTKQIINSTVSGNGSGAGGGGGILKLGPEELTILNSTIAANTAGSAGGGVLSSAGNVVVENSILHANSPNNCGTAGGMISSAGNNIDGGTSCGFAGGGDRSNTNPRLGSLADNGGPTHTHALRRRSPAINAASTAAPSTDQRGVPRVKRPDIGAYERITCRRIVVNRVGDNGRDVLAGTRRRDGILGLGGKDKLLGRKGNDALCGGKGKDTLKGAKGKDRLLGGPGRDRLLGGPGLDLLIGGKGRDRLLGGAGRDRQKQ